MRCRTCNTLISSPACGICGTGKKEKKKARIRKESNKRAKQNKRYREIVRPKFLTENPYCKVCGKPSTEIHHAAGRSGEMLNEVKYFMALCRSCHDIIERGPKAAREAGYSTTRTNK